MDKATLEMEPEYPARYFDDLATDLCTSKGAQGEFATVDPQTRFTFRLRGTSDGAFILLVMCVGFLMCMTPQTLLLSFQS